MKRVVLFSGGMDSTTALFKVAKADDTERVLALTMHYGSNHNSREMVAAMNIIEWARENRNFDIEWEHILLNPLVFKGGASALLGEQDVPDAEYAPQGEQPTVVPFRNANLIATAVSVADARGYDEVWIANHAADHLDWAYPDCSPPFIKAMSEAVQIGTMHRVRLQSPFLMIDKADIVKIGYNLGVPYEMTYSCYRGQPSQCGQCPTCKERKRAFDEAGVVDPTQYWWMV